MTGNETALGQLITRRVEELHPHPTYTRHHLAVPAAQLSALAKLGDLAFHEPIVVTRAGTIIDGYARWQLAQLQERPTLACIEYELTDEETLRCLLQRHRRSNGLNDFVRVLLALELEPALKERARLNQRIGGQSKDLSNLTEAQRLDVRSEIAAVAGVSVGSVTKVKQLTMTAHSELLQALRRGEIRIHRGWVWSKTPTDEQREALCRYRSERGLRKTIRNLISQHRSNSSPSTSDMSDLTKLLSALQTGKLAGARVISIDVPGRAVFVTEELFRSLAAREELALRCSTNNR